MINVNISEISNKHLDLPDDKEVDDNGEEIKHRELTLKGEKLPIFVDVTNVDVSKNMSNDHGAINVLDKSVAEHEAKNEDGYNLPAIYLEFRNRNIDRPLLDTCIYQRDLN